MENIFMVFVIIFGVEVVVNMIVITRNFRSWKEFNQAEKRNEERWRQIEEEHCLKIRALKKEYEFYKVMAQIDFKTLSEIVIKADKIGRGE